MIGVWAAGLLRRRSGRLLAAAIGVAVAVALLASLGSFLAASKASMTHRATSGVAIDWQVAVHPNGSGEGVTSVLKTVQKVPGTLAALPVGFADSPGFVATTQGTTQTTGAGKVLGIPSNYAATFPKELRLLLGSRNGVLVAQQTAANLHVQPGDTVRLKRAGMKPFQVTISGVVELPQADSLFQNVGAPPQSQPLAPPDNVLLIPSTTFSRNYASLATSRPDQVSTQIHVRRSHALPSDPAAAYVTETGVAKHVEVATSGVGVVSDNLGAVLDAARQDALYAQVLFLFLAAPGAALAAALTAAVAQAGTARRRREQAVLKARGGTTSQLLQLVLVEGALIAVAGGVVGLAAALLIGRFAFGSAVFGASTSSSITWGALSFLVGVVIAALVIVVPARRDLKRPPETRADAGRPVWLSYGLDFILIAIALAVFWAAGRNKYQLVLVPEGAHALRELLGFSRPGAGVDRCRSARLATRRAPPRTGTSARTPADASGSGQPGSHQRLDDVAPATNDCQVSRSGRPRLVVRRFHGNLQRHLQTPGRGRRSADQRSRRDGRRVTWVRHTTDVREHPRENPGGASGGADDPPAGVRRNRPAGSVRDQHVDDQPRHDVAGRVLPGGTASDMLHRLASRPDAVLVSAETVNTYQLQPGDLIRLRLQDSNTHAYGLVDFHYVGIVNEFPTAPKDSFFVTNASYVAQQIHSNAVGTFLVNTGGSNVTSVANQIRHLVGVSAKVTTINDARGLVGSSLTSVDLSGLTKLELSFALVIAAAAGGLVMALSLNERRRSIAVATVIGANRRQLRSITLGEPLFVVVIGLLCGVLTGWGLSYLLVKVLTGVFDPPPSSLTFPWVYLAAVAVCAIGAIAVGAAYVSSRTRRNAREYLREI